MLKIYDHPFSPYAQKVKISLIEKGVPYETVMPSGIGAGGTSGEFVEANPRAEVPALIDDGFGVFDSTIIIEYIEDKHPNPPMLPKSPQERARVRMLEEVMDTHFEANTWAMGEIRAFKRATGELAQTLEAYAADSIQGFYRWLEKQLGEREWFNGDAFGWGDLSVIPYLNGAVGQGHAIPQGTKLAAWFARANARPSVQQCVQDIAAFTSGTGGSMTDVAALVEAGLFKREYRDHRLEWMVKAGGLEVVAKGVEKDNIRFAPVFG